MFSGSETNFSLSETYSPNQLSCKSSQSSFFCNAESLLMWSVIFTSPSLSICIVSKAPPYSTIVLRVPSGLNFILSVWTLTAVHILVSPTRFTKLPATVFINCPTAVFWAISCPFLAIIFSALVTSFAVR